MSIIILLICFCASLIGAICGIGGGVIIKPVIDALSIMSVSAVSFLSGVTVLSMSTYSVINNVISKDKSVDFVDILPLALGGAGGGIVGKIMYQSIQAASSNPNRVGMIQATCLAIITLGTLIYTIFKRRIKTYHVEAWIVKLILGLMLGIMSSFLGIGGGPINLVVLFFFFSMPTKIASINSLYVIFFSQLANLIYTICIHKVPSVNILTMIVMIVGGILGGVVGRKVNKKIDEKIVEKLFLLLMVVIIFISIYNAINLS